MRRQAGSRSDEGFAMSSPVALMSAAAVVMAGVAFFVVDHDTVADRATLVAAGPAPVEPPVVLETRKVKKPTVKRSEVYIDVYNNSNITGLASRTSERHRGRRVAGRRLRQLVRHDPGHDDLLPRAAARRR